MSAETLLAFARPALAKLPAGTIFVLFVDSAGKVHYTQGEITPEQVRIEKETATFEVSFRMKKGGTL